MMGAPRRAWLVVCAGTLAVCCAGSTARSRPAVVGPDGGEKHVIVAQGRETPITLKVDPTTGSQHFVMGTAEIRQGSRVPTHRHDQDELIFVHKGTPKITLGEETFRVQPGTTIFIPEGTWIGLENTAPEPVVFLWLFGHPEFERWVREISVREGEPLAEKPAADVKEINAKYHMVFK